MLHHDLTKIWKAHAPVLPKNLHGIGLRVRDNIILQSFFFSFQMSMLSIHKLHCVLLNAVMERESTLKSIVTMRTRRTVRSNVISHWYPQRKTVI